MGKLINNIMTHVSGFHLLQCIHAFLERKKKRGKLCQKIQSTGKEKNRDEERKATRNQDLLHNVTTVLITCIIQFKLYCSA